MLLENMAASSEDIIATYWSICVTASLLKVTHEQVTDQMTVTWLSQLMLTLSRTDGSPAAVTVWRSARMPFSELYFNVDNGYLEGLVRGFKAGILSQGDYLNLVQCETLEGELKETEANG